ncbi:NAD(P)H-hydrate epimerase isoform X4 [Daphnia magna]|uniref:NAD(P)H-hydrate epimerase isoform X4 n=1 Tax=Daphnia magna TaxID=35525 RepID=UPI0014035A87|nr:NAD(P)H-hydrate epimerase isoform X4 [Daphnia magna]
MGPAQDDLVEEQNERLAQELAGKVSRLKNPRYLKQAEAIKLDEELFNYFGVEQLMELAGLSCASAIAEEYPESKNVLVVVGPGNNGGDGLVCARHLKMFGYLPEIFYPKRPAKILYENLTKQCELFEIPFLSSFPAQEELNTKYSLIVDALFGFSFKPPIRQEFSEIINTMIQTSTPCCSIDIPSGWDVENGPVDPTNHLNPAMLISLSAPKLCASFFRGIHYLGGRFIAPALATKYELNLPNYPSTQNCVRL